MSLPKPHKDHDLVITVIQGKAFIHFPENSYKMLLGDTVIVPKGVVHWLESIGSNPTLMNITSAPHEWNNDTYNVE
jgi:quercetin dioxygenase-like cupin family protein